MWRTQTHHRWVVQTQLCKLSWRSHVRGQQDYLSSPHEKMYCIIRKILWINSFAKPDQHFYAVLKPLHYTSNIIRQYPKTGKPGPVLRKNRYTPKPSEKRTPRAITLLIVVTSMYYGTRLLALLWWTMTHRHNCRRLIIYFDVSRFSLDGSSPTGIRSGQDQVPKAPFCSYKRVCFHLVSVCACSMPYSIQREIAQQS